jgi:hypothetical protein
MGENGLEVSNCNGIATGGGGGGHRVGVVHQGGFSQRFEGDLRGDGGVLDAAGGPDVVQ